MTGEEGTAVSPPLVGAVAQAIRETHETNTDYAIGARAAWLHDFLEEIEKDHAGFTRNILDRALEALPLPDHVRAMFATITEPAHQAQVLIGFMSVGSIVMQFVGAAIAPEVQAVSNVAWSANPDRPLEPAELALAVLRGVIDQGAGAAEARQSGVNESRFETLVLNTGEPPGLQQLQEALRRGYIDRGRFERGIRQSRVRNEWTDVLVDLRYAPVPVGEVLAAVVQGHISPETARHRIDVAGLNPDDYEWLFETHGRPPGVEMLIQLMHRGVVTEDFVRQAIRESDVKDKYIDAIIAGGRHLMPERTVVSAIRQGVLTYDQGIEHLRELGFNAADAATLASEAKATRTQPQRDLTLSMIHALYVDRLITEPAATARHARFQNTAIARVHSLYIAHRLTRNHASNALDKIGVDPTGRNDILKLWTDEREANVPRVSLAQLQGAIRRKVISFEHFRERVLAMGYAEADLLILYAESWPPSSAPSKLPA